MKRSHFMGAAAAVTAAGVVGVTAEKASAAVHLADGEKETGWNLAPNSLLYIKRYYILNAFPEVPFLERSLGNGPHVANAKVITAQEVHEFGDSIKRECDKEAWQEIREFIRTGKRVFNVTRFRGYDTLPTDFPASPVRKMLTREMRVKMDADAWPIEREMMAKQYGREFANRVADLRGRPRD